MKVLLGQGPMDLTGPIHDGTQVRQEFVSMTNMLISVEIFFATYKRENPGTIIVEILGYNQEIVGSAKIDATKLKDNEYREFGLGCRLMKGKRYHLRIRTEHCRSGKSVTAAYGDMMEGGPLVIGSRFVGSKELKCNFNYGNAESNAAFGSGLTEAPVEEKAERDEEARGRLMEIIGSKSDENTISGLISVVIPHFNCHEYLPKCLASIARQSYSGIEVIVVDDGSTKKKAQAKKIVESFMPMIPALRFIQLKKNSGAPAARNAGAAMAQGEYLFFCDADVELYSDTLELLLKTLLENQKADFSYGGFIWGSQRVVPREFDAEKLKHGNYITTMSLLRRSKYPGWDESLRRHQDWDLWLTVVSNGGTGVCCGRYIFDTPVREDGITSPNNISLKDSQAIVIKKHNLENL